MTQNGDEIQEQLIPYIWEEGNNLLFSHKDVNFREEATNQIILHPLFDGLPSESRGHEAF